MLRGCADAQARVGVSRIGPDDEGFFDGEADETRRGATVARPRRCRARSFRAASRLLTPGSLEMADFVHLHVHSQYSMLDGALKVKDLVKQVAEAGHERRGPHRPRQHVRRDQLLQGRQGGRREGDPRLRARGRRSAGHGRITCCSSPRPRRATRTSSGSCREGTSSPIARARGRAVRLARRRSSGTHEGAHRADRLHGRGGRAARPRAGRRGGRADARPAARSCSSRARSTSSCRTTGSPSSRSLNGILVELAQRARPAARRDERRALRRARGRRGAALPRRASRASRSYAEAQGARTTARCEMFLKSRRRDGARSSRDVPEAIDEHARDRREVLELKLKLGKPDAPELQVPEGLRRADATSATSRARASSGASREFASVGQEGRRGRVPQAPRDGARRHRAR